MTSVEKDAFAAYVYAVFEDDHVLHWNAVQGLPPEQREVIKDLFWKCPTCLRWTPKTDVCDHTPEERDKATRINVGDRHPALRSYPHLCAKTMPPEVKGGCFRACLRQVGHSGDCAD